MLRCTSDNRYLAALFAVDLGNYGRNTLPIKELFKRLRAESRSVQFIAYHWRRSGNFIFVSRDETSIREAETLGRRVIGLPCIARSLLDLERVDRALPSSVMTTSRGSLALLTSDGPRKLIYVALSGSIPSSNQLAGKLGSRSQILSWPSGRDVLCHYDRPAKGGDVGQVTNAVLASLQKSLTGGGLYATGRAIGVIRDLLSGNGLRYS